MSRNITTPEYRALRAALKARSRLAELVRIGGGSPVPSDERRTIDSLLDALDADRILIDQEINHA